MQLKLRRREVANRRLRHPSAESSEPKCKLANLERRKKSEKSAGQRGSHARQMTSRNASHPKRAKTSQPHAPRAWSQHCHPRGPTPTQARDQPLPSWHRRKGPVLQGPGPEVEWGRGRTYQKNTLADQAHYAQEIADSDDSDDNSSFSTRPPQTRSVSKNLNAN